LQSPEALDAPADGAPARHGTASVHVAFLGLRAQLPFWGAAMKKLRLVTVLAAVTLFAPVCAVKGQSDTKPDSQPAIAPAPRTVNLTAEQRFIIKEIVYKDMKVAKAPQGAPESIGDPVPSDVELHDMTAELAKKVPSAKSHKFYVTANAIVLVSPSDRTVADVIK
jgi:hypothetical protein